MRTISVPSAQVEKFDVRSENDILMAGFLFDEKVGIRHMEIQIEENSSELRSEEWGFYVEIDDKAFYDGVRILEYFDEPRLFHCVFESVKIGGALEIKISVPPSTSKAQRYLLDELTKLHAELSQSANR